MGKLQGRSIVAPKIREGVMSRGDGIREEIESEEDIRTLVVRAKDGDWVMGEDLVLTVTGDESIIEIQKVIPAIPKRLQN